MLRKWVEQDRPFISDILNKLPCLDNSRQVRELNLKLYIYDTIGLP